MNNFEQITPDEWGIKYDDRRWIRHIDKSCWISVLDRMTGFGYRETETAIVFMRSPDDPLYKKRGNWDDRECLIIIGDRREELNDMPKEKLREWYKANIDGNRNSMETILEAIKESLPVENSPTNPPVSTSQPERPAGRSVE